MADGRANDLLSHLRRVFMARSDAGLSDGQLLECFLSQRNEAAFATLVHRHAAMVLGVCRRVLCHGQDAEDAFQATFLVLVRKAAGLRDRRNLGNWLYGVAHHTALKARAARARRRFKELHMARHAEQAAPAPQPNDWLPLLDQALHGLPERYRQAIVLCDLEGKSRREAASLLGWREGTLSGRLARARVLLARRLTRRGIIFSGGAVAGALSLHADAPASTLVSHAVQAAVALANPASAAGPLSGPVLSLAEGVVRSMFMTKLKIVSAVILSVSVIGGGAGLFRSGAAPDGVAREPDRPARASLVQLQGRARQEKEIAEILKRVVSVHVKSVPLREMLDDVSATFGLNIVIDRRALGDMGVDESSPITMKLDNVKLDTALRLALKDLGLGYHIQEGVLIIGQPRPTLVIKMYPVLDLILTNEKKTREEELIRLICKVVEPQTWTSKGGSGTIEFYPLGGALVVNQSPAVQEQIEALLAGMRVFTTDPQ